ncbi:MAG: hypothetical protein HYV39_04405 [Candidatus Levybacteria bacterium]|nr:hypothetical protein [Candidatus Levybacteria bacterium]
MKTEKVVISFIAVVIGIFVAAIGFYFYQTTKVIKETDLKNIKTPLSPTPKKSSLFITLDSPKDEEVTDKRTITLSGTTTPNATVIVTTMTNDYMLTPTPTGSFSSSIVLENGQNEITILAVAQNGEEEKIVRTVTVSSETF